MLGMYWFTETFVDTFPSLGTYHKLYLMLKLKRDQQLCWISSFIQLFLFHPTMTCQTVLAPLHLPQSHQSLWNLRTTIKFRNLSSLRTFATTTILTWRSSWESTTVNMPALLICTLLANLWTHGSCMWWQYQITQPSMSQVTFFFSKAMPESQSPKYSHQRIFHSLNYA